MGMKSLSVNTIHKDNRGWDELGVLLEQNSKGYKRYDVIRSLIDDELFGELFLNREWLS